MFPHIKWVWLAFTAPARRGRGNKTTYVAHLSRVDYVTQVVHVQACVWWLSRNNLQSVAFVQNSWVTARVLRKDAVVASGEAAGDRRKRQSEVTFSLFGWLLFLDLAAHCSVWIRNFAQSYRPVWSLGAAFLKVLSVFQRSEMWLICRLEI